VTTRRPLHDELPTVPTRTTGLPILHPGGHQLAPRSAEARGERERMWTLVAPPSLAQAKRRRQVWTLVAHGVWTTPIRSCERRPVIPFPAMDSGRGLCGLSSRDSRLSRGLWSQTQIAKTNSFSNSMCDQSPN
jgi:hypothetical protein